MHLKNFSLLADEQGIMRLTPAYDLVCTRLVIDDDPLSLPIMGKKDNLDRGDWLKFAEYCQLPLKIAQGVLDTQASATDSAAALIDRSLLSDEQKQEYKELTAQRTAELY
jgi:serine/threonine-protein kinase HipA